MFMPRNNCSSLHRQWNHFRHTKRSSFHRTIADSPLIVYNYHTVSTIKPQHRSWKHKIADRHDTRSTSLPRFFISSAKVLASATDEGNDCTRSTSEISVKVSKMKSAFRDEQTSRHSSFHAEAWDRLWSEKCTPWDLGRPTPLLERYVADDEKRPHFKKFKRILVPGCGAGYDLITLGEAVASSAGEDGDNDDDGTSSAVVVGMDISPTSISRARDVVARSTAPVELRCDDFFSFVVTFPFDFIFDYTFFCALPLTERERWGVRMGEIMVDGGMLLTLIFPVFVSSSVIRRDEGPPYPVTVEDYAAVLKPNGFRIVEGPYESEDTVKERQGKEIVVWWQKVK